MAFCCWAMTLSQGHVMAHLMQMFTFVDLFSCFSTSMMNLATRDDSNAYGNESSATAERWPPYRSYDVIMYDVIAGHENIYVNNSSQNRGRTVGEVALCLSRQDASTDFQYDLPESLIRPGHLPWSNVKFSNWPFGVKMHVFLCVLNREISWCFAFFSLFLGSKVICKKKKFRDWFSSYAGGTAPPRYPPISVSSRISATLFAKSHANLFFFKNR